MSYIFPIITTLSSRYMSDRVSFVITLTSVASYTSSRVSFVITLTSASHDYIIDTIIFHFVQNIGYKLIAVRAFYFTFGTEMWLYYVASMNAVISTNVLRRRNLCLGNVFDPFIFYGRTVAV